MSRGRADREAQNLNQAPGSKLSAQECDVGLEFTNHEIMTRAAVRRLTNRATPVPQ